MVLPVGKRILIVDDDDETRRFIGTLLSRKGYAIQEAANGPQALRLIQSDKPNLVIVDVLLPGMSGHDVARRLRSQPQTANLPVVMLSGRASAIDRAEGLAAGADDYITKPVDPADLLTRIAGLLARSEGTHPFSGDLLKEIATSAVITLNAQLAWVLASDDQGRQLRSAAMVSASGEEAARGVLRAIKGGPGEVLFPLAPGINPLGEVLLTQVPIVNQGLRVLSQMPGGELLRRGLETLPALWFSIFPLLARGQRLGVFLLAHHADNTWEPRDDQVARAIVNQAAIALDNQRLMRHLEQSEREIRHVQSFHQTLVNSMGDGLLVLNSQGKIQFVNGRLCRMLDYEDTYLLGRSFAELLHPEDQDIRVMVDRLPGTTSFERRLIRRNGSLLPALVVHVPSTSLGTETGDILVVTDLSEIKSREEALRRRNLQLAAVERASRAMVSSLDLDAVPKTILGEAVNAIQAKAGSILLLEEGTGDLVFQAAVGPGSDKLVGARVPAGRGLVGWVVQTGQSALVDDIRQDKRFYRGIDQATGLTTTSVMAVPLLVHGRVIGALEVLNRLSGRFNEEDLKVLESLALSASVAIENARLYRDLRDHAVQLEAAFQELKAADKLKDELIQNVSHEMRTPLTFILGYVELLRAGELGPLDDKQREGLELVHKKCMALTKVVEDIASLKETSRRALRVRPVDLVSLAKQCLRGCAEAAEASQIQFELQADPETPVILGDEERLGQVLDNLLANAIKFSPEGGRVFVRIYDEPRQLKVEVRDMGIGIPTDQLRKVFERFYQVDGSSTRRFGGIGLGLAICKEVIEAHGGVIWVESQPQQGSSFFFTVPKKASPPFDEAASAAADTQSVTNSQ